MHIDGLERKRKEMWETALRKITQWEPPRTRMGNKLACIKQLLCSIYSSTWGYVNDIFNLLSIRVFETQDSSKLWEVEESESGNGTQVGS